VFFEQVQRVFERWEIFSTTPTPFFIGNRISIVVWCGVVASWWHLGFDLIREIFAKKRLQCAIFCAIMEAEK